MQVKVFEAKDMASGLKKVKEALGPNALILSTKTVRRGRLGVLGKPVMEITAAIDQPWSKGEDEVSSREAKGRRGLEKEEEITYQSLWKQRDEVKAEPTQRAVPPPYQNQGDGAVKNELSELRSIIEGLSQRIATMEPARVQPAYVEPEYLWTEGARHPALPLLRDRGISQDAAVTITGFLGEQHHNDEQALLDLLEDAISTLFRTNGTLTGGPDDRQKRIALTGATGVGKTTSIAKIAANYLAGCSRKVALITIDTYRIAAAEQLKVYGGIMQLPVEVVLKPAELEQALEKHRDCELILIDTAGRSPRNEADLQELASFLRPHLAIENHLVLDASKREEELLATVQRFGLLPIDYIIYSKIDECDRLGVLLNMHSKKNLPISFLTNGQRVPEDIVSPDPRTIARLILGQQRELHE